MKTVKVLVPDEFDEDVLKGDKGLPYEVWKPEYTEVLNCGFVGLVDFMGHDGTPATTARTSYGGGTKKVRSDTGLIRYLERKAHTSPIEFVETTWHIKCPIFVARQWIRHRTASVNEYSGRYSEFEDDFYIPLPEDLAPQSTTNKQGREGALNANDVDAVLLCIEHSYRDAFDSYEYLLGKTELPPSKIADIRSQAERAALDELARQRDAGFIEATQEQVEDVLRSVNVKVTGDEYEGLSRELARAVLPVGLYTQFYWKIDMHNLFHFLNLRLDGHAQKEIRYYGEAMAEYVKKYWPELYGAFEDYKLYARNYSRMENKIVADALVESEMYLRLLNLVVQHDVSEHKDERKRFVAQIEKDFEMSIGEARDFKNDMESMMERYNQ